MEPSRAGCPDSLRPEQRINPVPSSAPDRPWFVTDDPPTRIRIERTLCAASAHLGTTIVLTSSATEGTCRREVDVSRLSPTTLTTDEQRLILRATAAERSGFLAVSVQESP